MTPYRYDPTLDELIGDPITQAIMTADRVDRPKLEAMFRALAREIAGRPGGTATALLEPESARFNRNAVGQGSWPIGVSRDTSSCGISGSRIRSQPCGAP
jgi:hypothetical protein